MPFTVSHIAAVLPLQRMRLGQRLPLSALVIGSLLPDFGFLFGLQDRADTHGFVGLLTFCLPVGWLTQLLFWHLFRLPLLNLAPRALERRLLALTSMESRDLWPVSAALLLGALTHVVWDGFTHWTGFISQAIPALRSIVAVVDGRAIPLCDVLQHLSSVAGLLVLAIYWHRWASRTTTTEERAAYHRLLWRATLVCAPMAAALWVILSAIPAATLDRVLAHAAGQGLIAGAACLLVYALGWQLRHKPGLRVARRSLGKAQQRSF